MYKRQIAAMTLNGAAMLASAAAAQQVTTAAQGPEIVVERKLPPSRDRLMRTVYIGDLDLKSVDGRQEMDKRVAKAVEEMCAIPSPIPGHKRNMTRPCRDEAWASARPPR